jgi:light-regulated signal transduction histidine kinase (bacteriophytochrome)
MSKMNNTPSNIDGGTKDSRQRILTDKIRDIFADKLRNPLVPIMAYADMLTEGKFGNLNETQNEKLEVIRQCASLLGKNISDILAMLDAMNMLESTEDQTVKDRRVLKRGPSNM